MPMSKEDLEEAKANLRAHAQREIAKSELLQVRCEEQLMTELYAIANRRGLKLSDMVRTWLMERLAQERASEAGENDPVEMLDAIVVELNRVRTTLKHSSKASKQRTAASQTVRSEKGSRKRT